MIDLLDKDLDTEMTEAEVEEKNAQQEYDAWMADAKKDRTGLSKSLTEKTAAKADLEADQEKMEDEKKATTAELMATDKFISNLHAECDWLVQYFDVRKAARAGEIDSLDKAKAVLRRSVCHLHFRTAISRAMTKALSQAALKERLKHKGLTMRRRRLRGGVPLHAWTRRYR